MLAQLQLHIHDLLLPAYVGNNPVQLDLFATVDVLGGGGGSIGGSGLADLSGLGADGAEMFVENLVLFGEFLSIVYRDEGESVRRWCG